MNLVTWGLTAAVVALGSVASAQTEKPKTTPPPAPAQKEKAAPVAATQETQVWRLKELHDLELKNETGASVGEIDDLIIDTSDGRILHALVGKGGVMGIGEETHVVPWESLRLETKESKLTGRLTLSEAQISTAPLYRRTDPFDADLEMRARQNAGLKDGATRSGEPSFVTASALKGAEVRSPDNAELGKLDDIVVAPREGVIAYTVLATGGVLGMGEKHFALPWQTTKITVSPGKDGKLMVTAPLDKERLAKAPEFDGKDWKKMSSMPWMKDMYGYWTVDPYWSRTQRASSDKKIGG